MSDRWELSYRADRRALPLANRHYNRQRPESPQFVPPGRCVVLLTPEADALWVTSAPYAEYVQHAWAGAWVCSLFRNEGPYLSSELITEAVAVTRGALGEPPALGIVTFIDRRQVRTKKHPGYCYLAAGWEAVGRTVGGLYALQQLPDAMPQPQRPRTCQMSLFAEAVS